MSHSLASARRIGLLFAGASAAAIVASGVAAPAAAQDLSRTEIVVTTEKREASIQDVPIAVSAFDDATLERLNLEDGQDLQLAVPNLYIAKGNFTAGNVSLRGIGYSAVGTATDAGVGIHVNDVPIQSSTFFETEYFDLERLEVLRGPQGTLYGRNATGGVINAITAKPSDVFEGDLKLTYGNYDTQKAKGMINIPFGESGVGARLAGFYLSREGYTENLATGNDVDSRDLYSFRATIGGDLTDKLNAYVMYQHFSEDDSRMRSNTSRCTTDPDPFPLNQGCHNPDVAPGIGNPNGSGTLGALLGASAGLYVTGQDPFANPTIAAPSDPRTIYARFDPQFESDEDLFVAAASYAFDNGLTLTGNVAYQERFYSSRDDFAKADPSGTPFLVSSALVAGGFQDPLTGAITIPELSAVGASNYPTFLPTVSNSLYVTDRSQASAEQMSGEIRLQSDFDGPVNFNIGVIYADGEGESPYRVFLNTGVAVALASQVGFAGANQIAAALGGVPGGLVLQQNQDVVVIAANDITTGAINGAGLLGAASLIRDGSGNVVAYGFGYVPLDRAYFNNRQPTYRESTAFMGEVYTDVTDTFKVTVGLRHTRDDLSTDDYANLFTASTAAVPSALVNDEYIFARSEADFEETTGRIGFDWDVDLPFTDDTLLYAFYSTGYKSGGINPPDINAGPTTDRSFDPEFVNAIEIGAKNTMFDGRATVNATAFHYDYEGYQISKIINQTSVNENIDAKLSGGEFELFAEPIDNFGIDLTIGFLNSEVGSGVSSLDPFDVTAGQAGYVAFKDLVGGSAANCAVPLAALGAFQTAAGPLGGTSALACGGAAAINEAIFDAVYATAIAGGASVAVANAQANGTVAALSPLTSQIVPTFFEKDISGNSLPNAPELTLSLGAQYTVNLGTNWAATLRGDYYYQSESFTRVFNTKSDEIEAWDNFNLQLTFVNESAGLFAEIYGKNLADEDQIVNYYLADAAAGLNSNTFVLEPRLYGVTIGKRF